MTKNPDTRNFEIFNESGIDIPLSKKTASAIAGLVFEYEKKEWESVEVVYLDEQSIIELNKKHLQKSYITDIITFHYHDEDEPIEASLFCCAQRIKEQAKEYESNERKEFSRVLIHGILHLCGFEDASDEQKSQMRAKENEYLKQL